MKIIQLKALIEVVNTGSVTEAARRLYRTQPTISAVISSLEDELGFELFSRQGMRLKPTPAANFLLKEATEILQKLEKAQRTTQEIQYLDQRTLKIIGMPGSTSILLPNLLTKFLSDKKEVKILLTTKSPLSVVQAISEQNSDIGYTDSLMIESKNSHLVKHKFFNFNCYCAMRYDDPLSTRSVISPKELSGKPLAMLYLDHPTHLQTIDAFKSTGSNINTCFQAQYFIALFAFVENGAAYSIVDRLSMESYFLQNGVNDRKIKFLPFAPKVTLRTTIVRPVYRPMSLLTRQFYDYFKKSLNEIKSKPFTNRDNRV